MRSLIAFMCIVSAMGCIWSEFLRPYQPDPDASPRLERLRQTGRLWFAGFVLAFAFFWLFSDMEHDLPQAVRLGFLAVGGILTVISGLIVLGYWPVRSPPKTQPDAG